MAYTYALKRYPFVEEFTDQGSARKWCFNFLLSCTTMINYQFFYWLIEAEGDQEQLQKFIKADKKLEELYQIKATIYQWRRRLKKGHADLQLPQPDEVYEWWSIWDENLEDIKKIVR